MIGNRQQRTNPGWLQAMVVFATALFFCGVVPSALASGAAEPSHKGLGPTVPVPEWAKDRHIHFLPEHGDEGVGRGHLGVRCDEFYCPEHPLYYRGGQVQDHPHVYLLFWGSNWNAEPGAADRSQLIGMYEAIKSTAYTELLKQYFGFEGEVGTSIDITTYTETQGRKYSTSVLKEIAAEKGWSHTVNDQFVELPAPGRSYTGNPGYCGYHEKLDWGGGEYTTFTFLPYPGDEPFAKGCLGYDPANKDAGNVLSGVASHEFAESATDPFIDAWLSEDGYEISDICATNFDRLNGSSGPWVSGQWSNRANGCSLGESNPPHLHASTEAADGIAKTEATLHGTVNPGGKSTTYRFEYAEKASVPLYGTKLTYETPKFVPASPVEVGAGTGNVAVSQALSGLAQSTRYHFRPVATSSDGTTRGTDMTVVTKGPPKNVSLPVASPYAAKGGQLETANPGEWLNAGTFSYQWLRCEGLKCEKISGAMGSSYTPNIDDLDHSLEVEVTSTSAEGSSTAVSASTYPVYYSPPGARSEAPSAVTPSEATLNGTVNPGGWQTTYQFEYGKTTSYGKAVPVPAGAVGKTEGYAGEKYLPVSQTIKGLEPHTIYHFRITATNQAGTVKTEDETFTTPRTFSSPTYAFSFGSLGSGNGQLKEPWGIAVDPSANVWVADTGNNRVQKFNSKGEYQCQVGSLGSGNGQFDSPRGLAADASGNIWVADSGNNRIEEIGSKCEYVGQLGKAGTDDGQLQSPFGVAIDPSGNIWVSDAGNARIEKFSSKGEFLAACGSVGSGPGQFEEEPMGIATDPDGNVWVGDQAGRAEKFDFKCEYLAQFDGSSSGTPAWVLPWAIAIDPSGNLWLANSGSRSIDGFYPEGEYLATFGESGSGNGQFGAPSPYGIAAAADGSLWVTDPGNDRVQKWTPGKAAAVQSGRAASVKRTEATLTGKVNPEGKATSYRFEYGTTPTFGTSVPASPKSIGSGTEAVAVSEPLDGLKVGTTYYYHLVAITEEGVTYGETRHFTTLSAPGPDARWRIGGKTFAEAGLSEALLSLQGQTTIEISILGDTIELDCAEEGSAKLTSAGLSQETVTLRCTWVGNEECEVKPTTYTVNDKYEVEDIYLSLSESCSFFENYIELWNPSGSFEYGTEGKSLNVNATASAQLFGGSNPATITSDSHWSLTGANIGKTLGIENGPPEVFTQAASNVKPTEATLNGSFTALASESNYRFEYGTTTSYGTVVPKGGVSGASGGTTYYPAQTLTGLAPKTTYHYRLVASSNAGTTYGKDMTFTTLALPNPNWRIEGSTLAELEAWQEPYESHGAFTVESSVLGIKATVTCKESGSGTLGIQETMNLSECEAKQSGGKSLEGCYGEGTPIHLDGEFQGGSELTDIVFEEECVIGERLPVFVEGGLVMQAGAEAVEFPAALSEGTYAYVISPTKEHKAHVSIASSWKLTGKYKGEKFAFAKPEELNPNWRIEGSTLAELEAWEPYESHGAFTVESSVLGIKATVTCKESGSGTLGYSETMNLSECEAKQSGGKSLEGCYGEGTPIHLDGEFQGGSELTNIVFEEECVIGEELPVFVEGGLVMQAGAEAVEFPAALSEGTYAYVISNIPEHKAHVSIASSWKLTGKYKGSKFGYQ